MQKQRALKKKIIILSGIFLAVIFVLAALWYLLSSQESSSAGDFKKVQRETRTISSKINAIETKYELARNSISQFSDLNSKLKNGDLSISEQKVSDVLEKLNAIHRISNLKLEIDKIAPSPASNLTVDDKLETEFTNITIEFDALSDLHVLAFLKAIEDNLEGYLDMSVASISRERQITREVLQAFANGEKPRVVSAKVKYIWFGIDAMTADAEEVKNAQ